jgi:hypothetical protein
MALGLGSAHRAGGHDDPDAPPGQV